MASQHSSLEGRVRVDEHGRRYFLLLFVGEDCPGEVEICHALVSTRPNGWFLGKLDFLAVQLPNVGLPIKFTTREFSRRDDGVHYLRGKVSTSLDRNDSTPVCRYTARWTPAKRRFEMMVYEDQKGRFFDPFFTGS